MDSSPKKFRCNIAGQIYGPLAITELLKIPGFSLRCLITPSNEDDMRSSRKSIEHHDDFNWHTSPGTGRVLDLGFQKAWEALSNGQNSIGHAQPVEIPKISIRGSIPSITVSQLCPSENLFEERGGSHLPKRLMGLFAKGALAAIVLVLIIWGASKMSFRHPLPTMHTLPVQKSNIVNHPARPIPAKTQLKQNKHILHQKATQKKRKPLNNQ
jgi:hypothetical protein